MQISCKTHQINCAQLRTLQCVKSTFKRIVFILEIICELEMGGNEESKSKENRSDLKIGLNQSLAATNCCFKGSDGLFDVGTR